MIWSTNIEYLYQIEGVENIYYSLFKFELMNLVRPIVIINDIFQYTSLKCVIQH